MRAPSAATSPLVAARLSALARRLLLTLLLAALVGCNQGHVATAAGVAPADPTATAEVGGPTAAPTVPELTPTAATATATSAAPASRAVLPPPPPAVQAPRVAATPVPRTPGARFLVALDPGHGGEEVGAAAYGVVERESNLDMSQRIERSLRAGGVDVLLTRADGQRAPGAVAGGGFSATRADLQARVQAANAAGAAVFVSLHSNGSGDAGQRGVEVYYESRREFVAENRRLATLVLDGALRGLSLAGYPARDRGILDSACWRSNNGRCVGLFVLSPATSITPGQGGAIKEATNMPAVLAELLFISNPDDAALLRDAAVRDAMAQGVADGILRYLGVIE